jgi:DNA-directed RNA polymerase subunit M/transcription elongation factor TFIIS
VIQMDDYKGADGRIDWTAYRRAQVDAGESCRKCGSFIVFSKGYPTTCHDCDRLEEESGEVVHDSSVRCPKCRRVMNVHDSEFWDLYEEGEHEVSCRSCDHEFTVSSRVSYSFESPELLPEEAEPESEEGK